MSSETSDTPDPIDDAMPDEAKSSADPSTTGGAKLFVIFFLTIVPLLGIAIVAFVLYRLLVR